MPECATTLAQPNAALHGLFQLFLKQVRMPSGPRMEKRLPTGNPSQSKLGNRRQASTGDKHIERKREKVRISGQVSRQGEEAIWRASKAEHCGGMRTELQG
ncbi:hypothetical protein E1301_Tti012035 [Triplophysa tibetana]|uniref:Uncharacterized protein n=1 Tax=Triplophysa tibetana TaxID=1572043 RepID=A0A5A9PLB0_9TELE|nr:hypothetical protein E1301_Tti012035 [Triplophysa tibetana]